MDEPKCFYCGEPAEYNYDPFIAEIYPGEDDEKDLCEDCFDTRRDDI
jgi:DNA-directed RNA polymerase subunit N (RpoN/RPB10)